MGTLGILLQETRTARGIDLRDAAQQTRISVQYLKALEEEDFGKLPGEVFVKGFLKNYGRFLNLDESEVLKRYAELKPQAQVQPATPSAGIQAEKAVQPHGERAPRKEIPIEPFAWGALIFVSLLVFLFTSLPSHRGKQDRQQPAVPALPEALLATTPVQTAQADKLYLEVSALEDTWLLVRIDASPQKKAVLKRGESLIWSADDRFLVSYSNAAAVKLLLNGEELPVRGGKETVVRDMVITRSGIVNQPVSAGTASPARPKPKQPVQAQPHVQPQPQSPVKPQPQPRRRQEAGAQPAPATGVPALPSAQPAPPAAEPAPAAPARPQPPAPVQ